MTREIETWLSTAGANGSVVHELTVILLFGVYQVVWKRAGAELSMGWVDPRVGSNKMDPWTTLGWRAAPMRQVVSRGSIVDATAGLGERTQPTERAMRHEGPDDGSIDAAARHLSLKTTVADIIISLMRMNAA